jgi:hypothetical protein
VPVVLPTPPAGCQSPRELLAFLEAHVGSTRAAHLCADVLAADDPHEHPDTVLFLGGAAGRSVLEDGTSWKPYWTRTWGARGLLYVWDEAVAPVVVARLRDEHWRVAEMCLKVCVRRGLACGDDAVRLAAEELPRVRATAARALGACGDTEHVAAVRDLLDDRSPEVRRAAARALALMETRLDLEG